MKKRRQKKQRKRQPRYWNYLYAAVALLIALCVGYCDTMVTPVRLPDEGEPALLYGTQIGDDLRTLYREAFDNATTSIFLCVYSFSDRHLAQVLRRQRERGVTVTVVCDKEASPLAKRLLGSTIRVVLRRATGLMHLKIAIIDGKHVLLGTANMTPDALTVQGNLICTLNSEGLASYLRNVLDIQLGIGEREPVLRQATFSIGSQTVEMWLLPEGDKAAKRILQLIEGAKKTIRVAMFTFTRYDFANALARARCRGVDIQVTLDRYQTAGANKALAAFLGNKLVPVAVNRNSPLLHYKLMVVDDEILVCGSANWTKAAFTQNDDCFMVLHSLLPPQQARLSDLWQAIEADGSWLEEAA